MSVAGGVLKGIGILLILVGVVLIGLDYAGRGDTSGIDYKDLTILIVGVILAGIGVGLSRRTSREPAPPPAASPPAAPPPPP